MVAIPVQVIEQLVVGFKAFAETDAWVEDDLLFAVGYKKLALLLEKIQHGLVDVATKVVLMHGLRRAHAVHHHVGDMVLAYIR